MIKSFIDSYWDSLTESFGDNISNEIYNQIKESGVSQGKTLNYEDSYVVLVPEFARSPHNLSVLAHEIYHVAEFILDNKGIPKLMILVKYTHI